MTQMTIAQAAEAMGVTSPTVYKLIRVSRMYQRWTAAQIIEALERARDARIQEVAAEYDGHIAAIQEAVKDEID